MVKPWYGQNSLWQKITRSNGSGQTAPSRNRFRSKYGQTLSGQMRSNIIWSKYGQTSNIIWSNTAKHYLVKIRSNIIWSKYGQTLSGQMRPNIIWSSTDKFYPVKSRNGPWPAPKRSAAAVSGGQTQNCQNRTWPKQNLVKTASGQNPGAGPKRSAAAAAAQGA